MRNFDRPSCLAARACSTGILVALLTCVGGAESYGGNPFKKGLFGKHRGAPSSVVAAPASEPAVGEGTWAWIREPEQERRVMNQLYNRYCIRCHGVDGRGIWDIPDVPDFTNPVWQDSRGDDYLVQVLDLGRGACMPSFRGTLSREEYHAMARYLRGFDARKPLLSKAVAPPTIRPGVPETPANPIAPRLGDAAASR